MLRDNSKHTRAHSSTDTPATYTRSYIHCTFEVSRTASLLHSTSTSIPFHPFFTYRHTSTYENHQKNNHIIYIVDYTLNDLYHVSAAPLVSRRFRTSMLSAPHIYRPMPRQQHSFFTAVPCVCLRVDDATIRQHKSQLEIT